MSSPILHGTALCPLLRFPRGAKLRLKVVMDADLPLEGKGLLFAARSRYATSGERPLYRCTRAGSAEAWTATAPNTIELRLAPDAVDETAESELTLADLQAEAETLWRFDVLDEDELPILRLQGDLEWLQEEGAWPDDPASTAAIPTLNVSIVAGVATVSVALISDGVSVTNESINAAIGENAAATRTALGLGTAATQNTGAFDAAGAAAAAQAAAISSAAGSLSTHAALASGVHGITAVAATLLDDATLAAMRATLGLGSGDSVEVGLFRADSSGAAQSFSVPALKVGQYSTGLAHNGTYFLGIVVNGTLVASFDPRGGSNAVFNVEWPYTTEGRFRPKQSTVGTAPSASTYARCIEYFADGANGQPCLAVAIGGVWKRLLIGDPISAT